MQYDALDVSRNLGVMYGRARPLSLRVERTSATVLDQDLLKAHCRVDGDDLDDLLTFYEQVAIQWAEREMYRSILSREHVFIVSDFPRAYPQALALPRGLCSSVDKIEYYLSGQLNTLYGPSSGSPGGSDFLEDLGSENGGRVAPLVGRSWPSVDLDHITPVAVTYTAGWEDTDVPADIKHALMFAVADCLEFAGSADLLNQISHGGKAFDARRALLSGYVVTQLY
jgi:hypothetical protein